MEQGIDPVRRHLHRSAFAAGPRGRGHLSGHLAARKRRDAGRGRCRSHDQPHLPRRSGRPHLRDRARSASTTASPAGWSPRSPSIQPPVTCAKSTSSRAAGPAPAYVSTDASDRVALVANYVGGSVASLPIGADGALDAAFAGRRHTKCRTMARDQWQTARTRRTRIASSLTTTTGMPSPPTSARTASTSTRSIPSKAESAPSRCNVYDVFPGTGPRHLAFHPSGRWLYVTGELSSTLVVYAYDANDGLLREPIALVSAPFRLARVRTPPRRSPSRRMGGSFMPVTEDSTRSPSSAWTTTRGRSP